MNSLKHLQFWDLVSNPIIAKEMSKRARSRSSVVLVSLVLGLLCFGGILAYHWVQSQSYVQLVTAGIHAHGATIFHTSVAFIAVILFTLVTINASVSITEERKSGTLIPVQVSLQKPLDIVFGKIVASVAFSLLVVIAMSPMLTMTYMIGGISFFNIVGGLVSILFTSLIISVVSVFISARVKSNVVAILLSFVAVFMILMGFILGSAIIYGIILFIIEITTSPVVYYDTSVSGPLELVLGLPHIILNPGVVYIFLTVPEATGIFEGSLALEDFFKKFPYAVVVFQILHFLVWGLLAFGMIRSSCKRLTVPAKVSHRY